MVGGSDVIEDNEIGSYEPSDLCVKWTRTGKFTSLWACVLNRNKKEGCFVLYVIFSREKTECSLVNCRAPLLYRQ